MIKKMILLAMVVGALVAFAAPSMAGAAQLTQPAGTRVTIGTTVVGTSTNVEMTMNSGIILKCEKVTVNGIVNKNNGKEVEVDMDGEHDAATNCITQLGPIAIDPTLINIKASGAGPGTASFSLNETGLCEEASGASSVTWNGTDTIHITATFSGGCGESELHGDFTLETTTGVAVIAET